MDDDDDDDGGKGGNEVVEENHDDDDDDTILASVYVAREASSYKTNDNNGTTTATSAWDVRSSSSAAAAEVSALGKAARGPSCRSVLFSRPPPPPPVVVARDDDGSDDDDIREDGRRATNSTSSGGGGGGEHLYTACNGGSLRCIDTERACDLSDMARDDAPSPVLWSIENAHGGVGINRLYQLPHSSPCGPALVTGDDAGTVRLWDARMCGNDDDNDNGNGNGNGNDDNNNNNPFDDLMKLPRGCIQSWKVNHDYISDFESNEDGTTLFASSGDGTLSVFDVRYVGRRGTSRSVVARGGHDDEAARQQQQQQQHGKKPTTWETHGYARSDNQEDELLSLALVKKSQKLLVGTQDGTLCLFSYGKWGDISDRYPGHPQSIDAILKVDEDTVLTGSSDGLVRAVQLLPNSLLGVLGAHDGFPVEGLGWSAGRRMVGSVSHDDYVRLWDARLLNDEDDGDDDGDDDDDCDAEGGEDDDGSNDMQEEGVAKAATKAKGGTANGGGDDDWEDMDEDDDEGGDDDDDDDDDDDGKDSDDDDDSDDGDGGGGGGKPKKREKIFKTANESFFSDL